MNSSDIFKNYPLNSESYEYSPDNTFLHIGGTQEEKNIPTGGFLPIYLCEKGKTELSIPSEEEEKEQRGFNNLKGNIVSIQDVLKNRRRITPFIPQ